jgi:tetratricopeptide (TPR) repeat protein
MVSLANSYSQQGRHKEAESLYRAGLEISRRVNGPDHPDTLRWTTNLANDLLGQERYQEAEALFGQALEISRRVLGPDHPTTLRTIYNLACSAALRGDRHTSFGYLREAVDRRWATRQQLEEDEDLASLRNDPEFRALVARAAKGPG